MGSFYVCITTEGRAWKEPEYLMRKIDVFLLVTLSILKIYALNKNGDSQSFLENLRKVARTRLHLATSLNSAKAI